MRNEVKEIAEQFFETYLALLRVAEVADDATIAEAKKAADRRVQKLTEKPNRSRDGVRRKAAAEKAAEHLSEICSKR